MSNKQPKTANQSIVSIESAEFQVLSPIQQKYNTMLEKVEKQKKALANWQAVDEDFKGQVINKLSPLQEEYHQEQFMLLKLLDHYLTAHKFTKKQQGQLVEVIGYFCEDLSGKIQDDDFIAIYNRYSSDGEDDFSEDELAEMNDMMRNEFEQMFGIKFDDSVDFQDPESVSRYLLEQQALQEEARRASRKPRKKTAKQLAKEAQAEADAKEEQQSIQSIYRQLVKTLHPDRESDLDLRERKTQLMQEVTVAYEEKNLVRLLELQLTETQINHSLHQLPEDKINAFIRLLTNQLQQLKVETDAIKEHYRMMLPSHTSVSPKQLKQALKDDILGLERTIRSIRSERLLFEKDVEHLKQWLKNHS